MGVLSLTASGFAQANASIASIQSASTLAFKLRFLADPWTALTTSGQTVALLQVDDGSSGNTKIRAWLGYDGTGYFAGIRSGATGAIVTTGDIPASSMPASGNYVVLYGAWDAVNNIHIVSVYDQSGTNTLIDPNATVKDTASLGGLPVITGNGRVRINQAGITTQSAVTYDCLAIYSGQVAAGTEDATPTTSDSGILALWKFDDAPGSTIAAGSVGGQSMGITAGQFTFAAGGAWDPASGFTMSAGLASAARVGTVTATNNSAGGRVSLAYNGLADTVSSNPNVASLKVLSIALKFGVDAFNMGGLNNHVHGLFQIDDGTNPNCKITAFIQESGAGIYLIGFSIPGVGIFKSGTFTQSQAVAPLPPFGASNDVIAYYWWDNPNTSHGCALYDGSGNLIGQVADATNRVDVPVYTNGGRIRLNFSQDGTNVSGDPNLDVDGIAIFNQQRAVPWATPSVNEAGIVAFYRLDEQLGTTSVDDLGGPSLQLTNFTWESGGAWLTGGSQSAPGLSVTSCAVVAHLASGPSDTTGYLVTASSSGHQVNGLAAVCFVAGVGRIDATQYAVSVSSATATGTVFRGNVSANAFPTGVASQTAVGVVFTNINTPSGGTVAVPGLVSQAAVGLILFPSISDVAVPPGVFSTAVVVPATLAIFVPPPPIIYSSLQYVVDMATAFSTANQGLQVLGNLAQLIERARSDQKAIYAKLAARNRTYYLATASVTSSLGASARVIETAALTPPVERVLQLVLSDGRTVNLVDLLDTDGELAPRMYVMGTQLVEVGADWSPNTQTVSGTITYVGGPADLNPAGDLTQQVSVPPDWTDLLIIPMAQFLAAQDTGPAGQTGTPRQEEIQFLQQLYDQRLEAFLTYLDHYAGVPANRFDVPRPMAAER